FFEMTTGLAFHCFAEEKVDYAIIEVGLGGRLDCTNIISPALSIITNISLDHVQLLGNTLEKIATEKAGIIKAHTPVIIGEKRGVEKVFLKKATEVNAPIFFAEEIQPITKAANNLTGWDFEWESKLWLKTPLGGYVQEHNANTVLTAIDVLRKRGHIISDNAVEKGFSDVIRLTGLRGRWEKLQGSPTVICDTGHNTGGIEYIVKQLKAYPYRQLRIIFGMVNDKEIDSVLEFLPPEALYYFTQASVERALSCSELQAKALNKGLKGKCYSSVSTAIATAIQESSEDDMIFIGGSTFIVADALQFYERERTAS
ncbi:MAG: Mur ligase family protein, partial [Bacteroidales bacterium]|nr:Mur ligase family protein [Bacteroidales bacterium]